MFIIKYQITNSIFSFVVSGFDVAGSASVGSGFDVAGSGFVGSGFDAVDFVAAAGFDAVDFVAAAGFDAVGFVAAGFYAGFYFDFFDHQIDLHHLLEDLGQQNYHSLIGFGNFHLYC